MGRVGWEMEGATQLCLDGKGTDGGMWERETVVLMMATWEREMVGVAMVEEGGTPADMGWGHVVGMEALATIEGVGEGWGVEMTHTQG